MIFATLNSKKLFEIALGDIDPWQVVSIDLEVGESGNKELHIRLDFPAGSAFLDDLGVSLPPKIGQIIKR